MLGTPNDDPHPSVRFAKWTFMLAGIWGLLVLPPLYFMEQKLGTDEPPAVTHPEFYYGFIGVGIAWQLMFLVIGFDPIRYRLAMLPAIVEKASFFFAVFVLYLLERASLKWLAISSIDGLWMVLFLISLWQTSNPKSSK